MDMPYISIKVDIHGPAYPWIYTQYINGIYMDVRGISFDVYTCGKSMDIPGYS
jgi:hypothetical protein